MGIINSKRIHVMRLSILCSVDVNTISLIHQYIDRLLNRLFRSATKTTSKLHIIMLLWGESTLGDCWPVVSLPNGPVMRKLVLCHDVMTSFLVLLFFNYRYKYTRRHDMETFSASLALCEAIHRSLVDFSHKRPMMMFPLMLAHASC